MIGRLSLEEQQVFGGLTRHAGTLMVAPDLLDYVKQDPETGAPYPRICGRRERKGSRPKAEGLSRSRFPS